MSEVYRFASFKLLPDERLLLKRGVETSLGARAFDVLELLVKNTGHLVTKDALLSAVWRGMVVEENNLAVQIAALRKLIGAEAIATVIGRGYRFALEVWVLEKDAPEPPDAPPDGLAEEPPIKPSTSPALRSNLLSRIPKLVGRIADVAALTALLKNEAFVSLCGPAGVGKTHLAQVLAQQEYAEGRSVFWIELAALVSAEQLPTQIARALGQPLASQDAPLTALVCLLKPMCVLLVLDNCEHLAGSVRNLLETLLQSTDNVSVLVTSQVPIYAAQEQVYRLQALEVPQGPAAFTDPAALAQFGAVQLFVERMQSAQRHLQLDRQLMPGIVRICQGLDGNPLALCLAAARVPALGIDGLLARLDERLQWPTPGQRGEGSHTNALHRALSWSYELLLPDEQTVFRKLGVFAGGFALDWAVLCVIEHDLSATRASEIVLALVDRSLLTVRHTATPRYAMSETCRLFALQKLSETQDGSTPQHCFCKGLRWILDEAFEERGLTPEDAWRTRYEPELDNLRAALRWSLQHDVEMAVALVGSAGPLWQVTMLQQEARSWCDAVEPLASTPLPPNTVARYWQTVALCFEGEDPARARTATRLAAVFSEAA